MSEKTTSYPFRTAISGFNKQDVSAYITRASTAHKAALQALTEKCAALEQDNEALRQELAQLNAIQDASDAVPAAPVAAPAVETRQEPSSSKELELSAYRRAEAAERLSLQRAEKVYTQLQTICASTGSKAGETASTTAAALSEIDAQCAAIHTALDGLTAHLQGICTEMTAANGMLPDPAEQIQEAP